MGTGPGLETREEPPPGSRAPPRTARPGPPPPPQSPWPAGRLVRGATVLTSGHRVNCRLPPATHTPQQRGATSPGPWQGWGLSGRAWVVGLALGFSRIDLPEGRKGSSPLRCLRMKTHLGWEQPGCPACSGIPRIAYREGFLSKGDTEVQRG